MARTIRVDETTDLEVPDEYGPEETDRYVREFQAWREQQQAHPSEIPQSTEFDFGSVDPSQEDPWWKKGLKTVGSYARGTGQSIASVGDVLANVPEAVRNDIRYLSGSKDPLEEYSTPVSDWYSGTVPAQPKGSLYENAAFAGEVTGPAIVDAALTRGRSLAKGDIKPWQFIPKVATRAARDVGVGTVGGEAGGQIAATAGGEKYRDVGKFVGGMVSPEAAATTVRKTAANALMSPQSEGRLKRIDEYNAGLPPEQQIPITVGTVGKKPAATIEDVTGRSLVAPQAEAARRKLYENVEGGAQREIAKARGGPASGDITPQTIGLEAQEAIKLADQRATTRLQLIQNELEAKVGSESPTSLTNLAAELKDIVSNPKTHSAELIAEAKELRTEVMKNLQRPTTTGRRVTAGTAGYGAIKEVRSRLGRMLSRSGQGYSTGLKKTAYKGLTKDMEEAAAMQGVPPEEFAATQAETAKLAGQKEGLEALQPGPGQGETSTYRKTVGQGSTQHLEPLEAHTPDELVKLVADDLELRMRKGQAGAADVNPEDFDPKALQHWRTLSPDRKRLLSRNNPQIEEKMDALADIASYETARPGQRTRPNKSGSTLGTSLWTGAFPAGGAGLGGIAYMLDQPALATALLAGGIYGPRYVGKKFTDPNVVRDLVKARNEGIGPTLARAVSRPSVGGGAAAVNADLLTQNALEKAQEEERNRRMREALGIQ
jgi:hypothetical protein